MKSSVHDTRRFCPCCGMKGSLSYYIVPDSERHFTDTDGEQMVDLFDETKDYTCENCWCEFILVASDV